MTISPGDDQALYDIQMNRVSYVFLCVLKTNKFILARDDLKNENRPNLACDDIVVLYQNSPSSQFGADVILCDLDALISEEDCICFITTFQTQIAEYDQYADIKLHDTVKILKFQATFTLIRN